MWPSASSSPRISPGKLIVAFFQSLGGAFQPRTSALGIEKLDGLVAQGFVKRVAKITGAGRSGATVASPLPLCTTRLTDWLTAGIHFGCRRWNLVRIASTISSARARWNGCRPVRAS